MLTSIYNTERQLISTKSFYILLNIIIIGLFVIGYNQLNDNNPVVMLVSWLPFLLKGFSLNILISLLAMGLGTFAGLFIGWLATLEITFVRLIARWYVQLFRNAPLLVLVFFTNYAFPFELKIIDIYIPFPDWIKVIMGLALPASAHVAEIFRGAIQSIPATQWEASTSMAFSRSQAMRWIILPQCFRRMLPPWMNLYSSITMATTLSSLVGVSDLLESTRNAATTINQTNFTMLIYFAALVLFFIYCYPIARFTRQLEKRLAF